MAGSHQELDVLPPNFPTKPKRQLLAWGTISEQRSTGIDPAIQPSEGIRSRSSAKTRGDKLRFFREVTFSRSRCKCFVSPRLTTVDPSPYTLQ